MPADFWQQVDLALRLVEAAALGALIGLEREIHDHPAGMRTHLLVAVGAAAFTVLSIFAFPAIGADPARVAAQIVTGVGFLGAGAILKEGATIRGLTTAASLWAVAAVGMAAGAGAPGIAVATTFIVVVSLWPLRLLTERFVSRDRHEVRYQLTASEPGDISRIVSTLGEAGGTIGHLSTRHAASGALHVEVQVRITDPAAGAALTARLSDLEGITVKESTAAGD
jgi:putative Mg2+ transporter-C (MgtC) family protein